jgi:hypothetical protein
MGRGVAVACRDYKLGVKKCRSPYERGKLLRRIPPKTQLQFAVLGGRRERGDGGGKPGIIRWMR